MGFPVLGMHSLRPDERGRERTDQTDSTPSSDPAG